MDNLIIVYLLFFFVIVMKEEKQKIKEYKENSWDNTTNYVSIYKTYALIFVLIIIFIISIFNENMIEMLGQKSVYGFFGFMYVITLIFYNLSKEYKKYYKILLFFGAFIFVLKGIFLLWD